MDPQHGPDGEQTAPPGGEAVQQKDMVIEVGGDGPGESEEDKAKKMMEKRALMMKKKMEKRAKERKLKEEERKRKREAKKSGEGEIKDAGKGGDPQSGNTGAKGGFGGQETQEEPVVEVQQQQQDEEKVQKQENLQEEKEQGGLAEESKPQIENEENKQLEAMKKKQEMMKKKMEKRAKEREEQKKARQKKKEEKLAQKSEEPVPKEKTVEAPEIKTTPTTTNTTTTTKDDDNKLVDPPGVSDSNTEQDIPVPSKGYNLDFDNMDTMNPFGGGASNPFGSSGGGIMNDAPVTGGGGGYDLSKLDAMDPFGGAAPKEETDEDLKKGHIMSRISKSNYKARLFAYEELHSIVQSGDTDNEVFGQIAEKFVKILSDKNPMALEKALEFFALYCQKGGSEHEVGPLMKPLIENCFYQEKREAIIQHSTSILLEFFKSNQETCCNKINALLASRTPKQSTFAFSAVAKLTENLGPAKLDNLNLFIPSAIKASNQTNPKIKAAALDFFKMGIDWLGAIFHKLVAGVNKRMEPQIKKYAEENPNPTKSLKKMKKAKKKEAGGAQDSESESSEEEAPPPAAGLDAYDIIPAYDMMKEFNDSWAEKVQSQAKWKVKQDMLLAFVAKAEEKPKFKEARCGHIISMMKKLFMESNQMVHIAMIKVLGACANGFRKHFKDHARQQAFTLIFKYKEKKAVINHVHAALHNFLKCIHLQDIIDDIKEALEHKHAGIITNTMTLVIGYLKENQDKAASVGGKIVKILKKLTANGDVKIRDEAMRLMGFLKATTNNAYAKQMTDITSARVKKINKFAEGFEKELGLGKNEEEQEEVQAKGKKKKKKKKGNDDDEDEDNDEDEDSDRGGGRRKSRKSTKRPSSSTKQKKKASSKGGRGSRRGSRHKEYEDSDDNSISNNEDDNSVQDDSEDDQDMVINRKRSRRGTPQRERPSSRGSKRKTVKPLFSDEEDSDDEPVVRRVRRKTKGGGKSSSQKLTTAERLPTSYISMDDVHDKFFDEDFPQDIMDSLSQKGWEAKLKGIKGLYPWLADNMSLCEEALLLLRASMKGFKEANPKVNKGVFKILMHLSEEIEDKKKLMTPTTGRILLEFIVERMNDKIFTEYIQSLAIRCFSVVCPKSFIATLIDIVNKRTTINPKMANDLVSFFSRVMPILTPKYLPFGDLVIFAKEQLTSKMSSSRKIGMEILSCYYSMLGDAIKEHLEDVNHSVLNTLDSEFSKRQVQLKPLPTIEILGAKPLGHTPAPQGRNEPPPVEKPPRSSIHRTSNAPSKADMRSQLQNLVQASKSSDWNIRKNAFEDCSKFLKDCDYKIRISNIEAIVYQLVNIGDDNHKLVLKSSLEFLGEFCKGLGSDLRQYSKIFLDLFLKHLQNKNESIRKEVVRCLNEMCDYVDTELLYAHMLHNLSVGSDDAKVELYTFLVSRSADLKTTDFKSPAVITTMCKMLYYRHLEVRKLAEELVAIVVPFMGSQIFRDASINFKEAKRNTVIELLDRLDGDEEEEEEEGGDGGQGSSDGEGLHGAFSHDQASVIRPRRRGSQRGGIKEASTENSVVGGYEEGQNGQHKLPPRPDGGTGPNFSSTPYPHAFSSQGSKTPYEIVPREQRLLKRWGLDGPKDQDLIDYMATLPLYFNESMAHRMFSVEIKNFESVIQEIHQILFSQPNNFLQIIDLILQWIWIRSYESRPDMINYFVQLLHQIIQQFTGQEFLAVPEKEYLVACCLQIQLTQARYLKEELTKLFQKVLSAVGEQSFARVLIWTASQNAIVYNFHLLDILNLITLVIRQVGGYSFLRHEYLSVIEDICYKETSTNPNVAVDVVKSLYILDPALVSVKCSTRDNQLIDAVKHFLEKEGTQQQQQNSQQQQQQSDYVESSNLEFEEPQNIGEDYGEEGGGPIQQGGAGLESKDSLYDRVEEPEKLQQVDEFVDTILEVDDYLKGQLFIKLRGWMKDPSMRQYVSYRGDFVIGNMIKFVQDLSSMGVNVEKINLYNVVFSILQKVSEFQEVVDSLSENTIFDFIDTLILLLLGSNRLRQDFEQYSQYSKKLEAIQKLIDQMNHLVITYLGIVSPNILYLVLTDLLIKSKEENVPDKFSGLIIKLIVRLIKKMDQDYLILDLQAIFVRMASYLGGVSPQNYADDLGCKAIKTFVTNYIKISSDSEVRKALEIVQQFLPSNHAKMQMERWLSSKLGESAYSAGNRSASGSHRARSNTGGGLQKRNGSMGKAAGSQDGRRRAHKSIDKVQGGSHSQRPPQGGLRMPPSIPSGQKTAGQVEGAIALQNINDQLRNGALGQFPKLIKELYEVSVSYPDLDILGSISHLNDAKRVYVVKELEKLANNEKSNYSSIQSTQKSMVYNPGNVQTAQKNKYYGMNSMMNFSERKLDTSNNDTASKIEEIRAKMKTMKQKK